MSKSLEPRSVSFSDYKIWFSQTNELLKRQWIMVLTLGLIQLSFIYVLGMKIIPFLLVEENSSIYALLGFMGLSFCLFSIFNMRFFYTHLAYSSDFSLGKGPSVLIDSMVKRWRSLLLELKYIITKTVIVSVVMLIIVGAIFYLTGAFDESSANKEEITKPAKEYVIGMALFTFYVTSRFFCYFAGLTHKYPLLACLGLGDKEYSNVRRFADDRSEMILMIPMLAFFMSYTAFVELIPSEYTGLEGFYTPFSYLVFMWAFSAYSDFMGYVMCRDIYLGQTENQTEKAKETSAVPEAV